MSKLLNREHSFKGRVKVPITDIFYFALDSIHRNRETILNWEDRQKHYCRPFFLSQTYNNILLYDR